MKHKLNSYRYMTSLLPSLSLFWGGGGRYRLPGFLVPFTPYPLSISESKEFNALKFFFPTFLVLTLCCMMLVLNFYKSSTKTLLQWKHAFSKFHQMLKFTWNVKYKLKKKNVAVGINGMYFHYFPPNRIIKTYRYTNHRHVLC